MCNGFANQRLSVVYGVLLAHRLGRSPVLPVLMRDGIQRDDKTVTAQVGPARGRGLGDGLRVRGAARVAPDLTDLFGYVGAGQGWA